MADTGNLFREPRPVLVTGAVAWLAVLGFLVSVAGALALARFGEAPPPQDPGISPGASRRPGEGRRP